MEGNGEVDGNGANGGEETGREKGFLLSTCLGMFKDQRGKAVEVGWVNSLIIFPSALFTISFEGARKRAINMLLCSSFICFCQT